MERIYSSGFPGTHDINKLIGARINDFNFFIIIDIGRSIVIYATNDRSELFDFKDFKNDGAYVVGKNPDNTLSGIDKRDIAKEKIKSLPEDQQFEIIEGIMIDRMLGKI